MEKRYFKIDEIAAKTGISKRALRYYEEINLIIPKRADSGYRIYSDEDLEKINKIKELKESLGFTLKDIKYILELEKNVKEVLTGDVSEVSMVDNAIVMMENLIQLIKKKEETIKNTEVKCNEILQKLIKIKGNIGNIKGD
ncbi:MerR family transcriptional regulator [Aceticella autotrophica]|uniref:MerR family transcriptional regulator n=1 Tax=Aceticella autotrophica TaxID=2755338 RepID=A0A975GA36_9THEO|nr:MerR family transcriptional regulator [Aceticella autotrophica]QSZ26772.1 MerR family transcriptional regulator [Aceticella autotrophica]